MKEESHSLSIRSNWSIQPSSFAVNSINPIRQIVENLNVSPNPDKKLIPLSIGSFDLHGYSVVF